MYRVFTCPVAPYVGAWIEIQLSAVWSVQTHVAPYVGAWIEMLVSHYITDNELSLLMWERGLKYQHDLQRY